jgi:competence protein ComEC
VDFLKLGHHGSAASLTQAQARTLRPSVAVASAGEHNSYGHPDPACVQALEAVGARFLCTKDCGDVTLYARGGLAPGTSPPRSTTI